MTKRTNNSVCYAHSVECRPRSEWETQAEHGVRVATAARRRAELFNAGDAAEALGLLHDLGKEKPAFQRRLKDPSVLAPHAAEGGKAIKKLGGIGALLAAAIVGHHGRLLDPDDLRRKLDAAETVPLPDWCAPPTPHHPTHLEHGHNQGLPYRTQFLVRMLYGALTDADDRETRAFYDRAKGRVRKNRPTLIDTSMRDAFDDYMRGLKGYGPVNDLRRRVFQHSREQANNLPGLFTLTVPTGGGKTLTSLGFALDHALKNGLTRLIYVIPFTSIVEQTAQVFRKVFPDPDIVLEHHANADWDGEDETEAEQLRVMGSSWDVPIVVTTAVQFFESLHAARKKRCRKLPSLARSVIVLDEAQSTPLQFLRPCLAALSELIEGYGASVVLSTATQPALGKAGGFPAPEALEGAREIAPDPDHLYDQLKRVVVCDVGVLDDASVAKRITSAPQALAIVDNRMQARALFDSISDKQGARHLSTLMTPSHRSATLSAIRADLKEGKPVRLVATSVIEAGVDVDFPYVLRAAAGIDSIAQAAGRCNREGKLGKLGRVEVFQSEHEAPPAIEQFAKVGRRVLAEHSEDPIGRASVDAYFRELWFEYGCAALDATVVGDEVQTAGILSSIERWGAACHFETLETAFRLIDDTQPSLAVLGGEYGADLNTLTALHSEGPGAVSKALQPYTISVPFKLWRQLREAGLVRWLEPDRFDEQFAILDSSEHYDDRAGLRVDDMTVLDGVI